MKCFSGKTIIREQLGCDDFERSVNRTLKSYEKPCYVSKNVAFNFNQQLMKKQEQSRIKNFAGPRNALMVLFIIITILSIAFYLIFIK
jgi:hypothetical protein